MHANLTIQNSELHCQIIGVPQSDSISFVYRLLRHTIEVHRSEQTKKLCYAWSLDELAQKGGGHLHVEVDYFCDPSQDAQTLTTNWQFIAGEKLYQEYTAWVKDTSVQPIDLPEFSKNSTLTPPFHHLAFIKIKAPLNQDQDVLQQLHDLANANKAKLLSVTTNEINDINIFEQSYYHKLLPSDIGLIFTSTNPLQIEKKIHGLGSGFAFYNNTLLREADVVHALKRTVTSNLNNRDLALYSSETCGDFLSMVFTTDHVEFHSDYFGTSSWYEYKNDNMHVVASSFLLAIQIAIALKCRLALNIETIDADLCSLTQPFQQHLLDKLQLLGFTVLSPNKILILLNTGGFLLQQSQLGLDIAQPPRFTIQNYHALLANAGNEIMNNCRAIIRHHEFEVVACDISGGLDSRLVLAAFLSIPEYQEKLRLRTAPSSRAPSPNDEETALLVAKATNVPWDTSPRTVIGRCSHAHLTSNLVRACFGIYWLRNLSSTFSRGNYVSVGGTQLDDIARDYVTKAWAITHEQVDNPEEIAISLVKQVFKWRGRATMKASPYTGVDTIAQAWGDLPGDESEKASQIFNYHRARVHGSGLIPAWFGEIRMNPGPTRSLFLLRLMSARILGQTHAQMNLLNILNPKLAKIPYGDKRYNEEFQHYFGQLSSNILPDRQSLADARATMALNQTTVPCAECNFDATQKIDEVEMCMRVLHGLCQKPSLQALLLPVYNWAHEHLGSIYPVNHTYSIVFKNKIYQLAYLVDFVTRSEINSTKRAGIDAS